MKCPLRSRLTSKEAPEGCSHAARPGDENARYAFSIDLIFDREIDIDIDMHPYLLQQKKCPTSVTATSAHNSSTTLFLDVQGYFVQAERSFDPG